MRAILTLLLVTLAVAGLAPAAAAAPQAAESLATTGSSAPAPGLKRAGVEWRGRNAFDVWKDEHRWVRIGLRFYALGPQEDQHARLGTGAGLAVPITTDFFMGVGMKVGFLGGWNAGQCEHWGVDLDLAEVDASLDCGDAVQHGVDYKYREPRSNIGGIPNPGADPDATPGEELLPDQRRDTHVAHFALSLGVNYELTIPNVQFFRIVQPFLGGGAVVTWVITYSDMREGDYVLINNADNDTTNPTNLDPYALTEAVVGGEIYGGFHLNLDKVFRLTVEFGYYRLDVPSLPLTGATEGWDAVNLAYTLAEGRVGLGLEFRF